MADQQLEDLGTLSAGTIAADDAFLVNDDSDTTNDAGGEPKTITVPEQSVNVVWIVLLIVLLVLFSVGTFIWDAME